ncbi:putative Peroxidase 48 [Punica granatum]|uniref:Peroxidase n=2 Tax=Punica granatum TaxID=22663 RepID=A0A6P8E573_PUNGR|nr:putative Peroxidase 48 [Punica granatum]
MDLWKQMRFFTFTLLVYTTTMDPKRPNSTQIVRFKPSRDIDAIITARFLLRSEPSMDDRTDGGSLEYDYYRESCPRAERIVREMVQELYQVRPRGIPSLLRLAFHDCFVEGCDASILLDPINGMASEKDASPNELLKGYDIIEAIKFEIERACPRTVSCADILVLAAREALLTVGGPFYPLQTGRRDSMISYAELAEHQLPSPFIDLSEILSSFGARGFNERETVSLLGAHSVGSIHCKFFEDRLYNFSGTNRPDPSLESRFLNLMRSRCSKFHSASSPKLSVAPSPSVRAAGLLAPPMAEPETVMSYEGLGPRPAEGPAFGAPYYRSLLEGRGILFSDQQLTGSEETGSWVRAYAWDTALFRKDFAETMLKLSSLQVLTAPNGQVRVNCSKIA